MLRILIALTLIFNSYPTFAQPITVNDLKKQFPGAKIQQVTLAEFEQYKKTHWQEPPQPKPLPKINPCQYKGGIEPGSPVEQRIEEMPVRPNPSYDFDTYWRPSGGGGSSNGKEILVIVAVIGVVVVAFLVVYSIGYIVTMAQNGFECQIWRDVGFRTSYITDQSATQVRTGRMNSVFYSHGYMVPFGVMGLTGELGFHDLNLTVSATGVERQFKGTYLLAGPSFSIPFNKLGGSAFQIELLAGTSTEKDIGFMSTLRLGVELNVNPEFSLGINLGAALINIKGFDNFLKDDDQLNFMTGAAASYRW
jgi:hypothetical protein